MGQHRGVVFGVSSAHVHLASTFFNSTRLDPPGSPVLSSFSPTLPSGRRQNTVHSAHPNAHFALLGHQQRSLDWTFCILFAFTRNRRPAYGACSTTIISVILIFWKGCHFDRPSLLFQAIVVSILQVGTRSCDRLHTALSLPDTWRLHSSGTHLPLLLHTELHSTVRHSLPVRIRPYCC